MSSSPRVLYLPALLVCALILYETHRYVKSKLTQENTRASSLAQSATTIGSNSPIIQAAPGSTVSFGFTAEQVQVLLSEAFISQEKTLEEKYPFGFILFGLANGQIIYRSSLKSVKVEVDWAHARISIDASNHIADIVASFVVDTPTSHNMEFTNVGFGMNYKDNEASQFPFNIGGVALVVEVLDSKRGLFMLGFRQV